MRVTLLDGDTVQTISVARSLKSTGAIITVFCFHKISYGYQTRFADKKVLVKHHEYDQVFLDFLLDFLNRDPQDIVIPLFDDSALFLSKNKSIIEQTGVKAIIINYEKLNIALNKGLLMEFCRKNGIPHPETFRLNRDNLQEAAIKIGFPSLIKPDISSGAKGISRVENISELNQKFPDIEKEYGSASLQEFIRQDGIYYNAMLYRNLKGSYSKTVVIEIKRYFPVKGGTSCYCSIIVNRNIDELCRKLLDLLEWEGFADIDILVDKTSGDYKVIEINPRIPSSIHAAFISGVNFPEIMIRNALYGNFKDSEYIPGKNLRYLAMDLMWFLFSKERFSNKHKWFRFFVKDTFYQDLSSADPFPFFAGTLMGVRKYASLKYLKSKLKK